VEKLEKLEKKLASYIAHKVVSDCNFTEEMALMDCKVLRCSQYHTREVGIENLASTHCSIAWKSKNSRSTPDLTLVEA